MLKILKWTCWVIVWKYCWQCFSPSTSRSTAGTVSICCSILRPLLRFSSFSNWQSAEILLVLLPVSFICWFACYFAWKCIGQVMLLCFSLRSQGFFLSMLENSDCSSFFLILSLLTHAQRLVFWTTSHWCWAFLRVILDCSLSHW